MKKRIITFLLCFALVMPILPAFATETAPTETTVVTEAPAQTTVAMQPVEQLAETEAETNPTDVTTIPTEIIAEPTEQTTVSTEPTEQTTVSTEPAEKETENAEPVKAEEETTLVETITAAAKSMMSVILPEAEESVAVEEMTPEEAYAYYQTLDADAQYELLYQLNDDQLMYVETQIILSKLTVELPDGKRVVADESIAPHTLVAEIQKYNALDALDLSEEMASHAFEIDVEMNPYATMALTDEVETTITLENVVTDPTHDAAIVLHFLHETEDIIEAVAAGEAWVLKTTNSSLAEEQAAAQNALGMDGVVVFVPIDGKVNGSNVTFTTTGFSTYYVVSGHNDTLKSWWQDSSGGTTESNTRYNLDLDIYSLDAESETEKTFVVEPDSSFYMWVKNVDNATWEIINDNANGHITIESVANDSVGKVIRVSGTAAAGESLTFTAGGVTVTIQVKGNVVEDTFNNPQYPVYVGITFDPTKIAIANEPRVSGNDTNDWTYVTNMNSLTITGSSSSYKQKDVIAPVADSKAIDYLVEDIKNQSFLEGTDDDSVKGLIDTEMQTTDGNPPTVELDNFVKGIQWSDIAKKLLSDSNISSKIKATDGATPTMANYGQVGGYVLQPYVVKLQTSKYVGWHINACFVPVRDDGTQWMNFDENLPEGAYVDYLNVPLRKPLKTGSTDATTSLMYSVQPGGTDYVAISESEYITLSDGRKLRFIGWNTQPDGSGCQYPGQGATYTSPSNDSGYWAGKTHDHSDPDTLAKNPFLSSQTGTMYAFWSAIAERLELHKIVESDVTISSPATFEFKLTITSLEGVQLSQDGGDKIVFELYDAATDTLVPNSKDSNTALAVNNTVTIRMTANQYAAIFLPTGTQYKIEEINIPYGYTKVNSVNAEGTIGGKGNDGNVIFTNSYNSTKGFLNLEKTVEGEGADENQLFNFTVTFDDEKVSDGKYNNVEFTLYDNLDKPIVDTQDRVTINEENKRYNIRLKHDERIVFSGLEAGTTYNITETEVDNYVATVTTQGGDAEATQTTNPASGTIVEDKFTNVHYTNTFTEQKGSLRITKNVAGIEESVYQDSSFVFTVVDSHNESYTVTLNKDNNWKMTIEELPLGNATVTETKTQIEKYNLVKIQAGTADVTNGENNTSMAHTVDITANGAAVTFTNTYERAITTMTITKNANVLFEDDDRFVFDVVNSDGSIKFSVTLSNNQTVTVNNVTVGDTYTVTERTAWSWRYDCSKATQTVVIDSDQDKNKVEFTNTLPNINYWLSGSGLKRNDFN